MKKIYSSPSLFGGMNYYDESGHQIGYATEGASLVAIAAIAIIIAMADWAEAFCSVR
jgi:hypothetical protein